MSHIIDNIKTSKSKHLNYEERIKTEAPYAAAEIIKKSGKFNTIC